MTKIGILAAAATLLVGGASASSAEVNCKFVLKNLSLPGRTVESVAETMSISEDEIRACQEQEKAAAPAETKSGDESGDDAKE